ncbi:L-asparaginase II [Xylariales sp. PMI_506]|nr:L-asparaginase II [Xylariales sp. PMI_506]
MVQLGDCVVTDRGGIIENRHLVHAAVVDSQGRLLYAVGNPSRITLARSAAKPAQVLAILETGSFDRFEFDDADLALMCASHNSEDRHLHRTRTMLSKVGAWESDLKCGGHVALSESVNRAWIKSDFIPGGACNNCSGKHVGMIAGAKALGAPIEDYHSPQHPMQIKVREVVESVAVPVDRAEVVQWGLDGCNLPAPAFALEYLAQMYAAFAHAADVAGDAAPERTKHMARIFHAMHNYPELVGGEGRYCTELMRNFKGLLVGKLGADGCYGVSIRSSEQTRKLGAAGGLGIAVKIEDGSIEILYAVVSEILEQLQIGTKEMRDKLGCFHHLKRLNTMNVVTGEVTLAFNVREVSL